MCSLTSNPYARPAMHEHFASDTPLDPSGPDAPECRAAQHVPRAEGTRSRTNSVGAALHTRMVPTARRHLRRPPRRPRVLDDWTALESLRAFVLLLHCLVPVLDVLRSLLGGPYPGRARHIR